MQFLYSIFAMETEVALQEVKKIINNTINIDELIDLVRDRPVIWDRSVEGYRNKEFSGFAWEQICRRIFNTYDDWGQEQKIYVEKMVKQKWTTTRDVWQRNYRKRKDAMQTGENLEIKENARYEKLKFLAKVYEKYDNLQSTNDEKMVTINLEDMENPPSPQADPGSGNINFDNFQQDLIRCFNKRSPNNFNMPPQKRRHENGGVPNVQFINNEQGTSAPRTTVVNVEDRMKVENLLKASKRRMSSNDLMKPEKISRTQAPPQVPSSPRREEISHTPKKQSIKNNPEKSSQKNQESKPHVQPLKQENFSNASVSTSRASNEIEPPNVKVVNLEQINIPADREKSSNTELEHFIQILRPTIKDFNDSQMMKFLVATLKPLIAGFDKRQLRDFQIETLKLVGQIEGQTDK
ncbi:uncharacterized protein LOC128993574 [Macrosteles quadrilineatus]|uniref:uncharacterized protein LOC128993574 n=1 Tax=Macrosteles quadrilineatus TaxID=74068 RepID=UPI0023E2A1C4|nr:uncharacterized protein LOC128993574 [Macrosteles quadrilineatus]